MNRRAALQDSLRSVVGLAFTTFLVATNAATTPPKGLKHQNIVIQVSDADPARWSLALSNAKNLQAEMGAEQIGIELVAYGPGVAMLKLDSTVAEAVAAALAAGVAIVACENTLHAKHLSHDDLLPGIGFVQSGAGEIMRRQLQGWAYLRP